MCHHRLPIIVTAHTVTSHHYRLASSSATPLGRQKKTRTPFYGKVFRSLTVGLLKSKLWLYKSYTSAFSIHFFDFFHNHHFKSIIVMATSRPGNQHEPVNTDRVEDTSPAQKSFGSIGSSSQQRDSDNISRPQGDSISQSNSAQDEKTRQSDDLNEHCETQPQSEETKCEETEDEDMDDDGRTGDPWIDFLLFEAPAARKASKVATESHSSPGTTKNESP